MCSVWTQKPLDLICTLSHAGFSSDSLKRWTDLIIFALVSVSISIHSIEAFLFAAFIFFYAT